MPIAPMIDCVFLMLVYFMTTSSLKKAEAELLVGLSGSPSVFDPVPSFDNQTIRIDEKGKASLNGFVADDKASGWRAGLALQLEALKQTSKAAGTELKITVAPAPQSPHSSIIDILDALQAAGVESVRFP